MRTVGVGSLALGLFRTGGTRGGAGFWVTQKLAEL
jgi:hypothetical protein